MCWALMGGVADAHVVHFTGESQPRVWRSPQTYGPDEGLSVALFANGKRLHSATLSDCEKFYGTRRLTIRLTACGRHLVVRYYAHRGTQRFTLRYG